MAMNNIERLLRLTADYHNFCNDERRGRNIGFYDGELDDEDLDFVTAAAQIPPFFPRNEKKKQMER